MEIKINEMETYNIKLPEKVDIQGLQGVLSSLNRVLKVAGKMPLAFSASPKKEKAWTRTLPWNNDRDASLVFLKMYFHAKPEDKNAFAEKYNRTRRSLALSAKYIREKFKIMPEEVGLIRWPHPGEKAKNLIANKEEDPKTIQ